MLSRGDVEYRKYQVKQSLSRRMIGVALLERRACQAHAYAVDNPPSFFFKQSQEIFSSTI